MNDTTPATYVDEEIEALEARKVELQAQREKLLAGQVAVGFEGQEFTVDVSSFPTGTAGQEQLAEILKGTTVFDRLTKVEQDREEVKSEMIAAGVLPRRAGKLNSKGSLLLANYRLTKWIRRKASFLGFLNSPWLMALGVVILILWFVGFGGQSHRAAPATATPVTTTASPTTPSGTHTTATGQQSGSLNKISYILAAPESEVFSSTTELTPSQAQAEDSTPTISSDQPTRAATITPTTSPAPDDQSDQSGDRVGQAPSNSGGFNGPHGAFLAPSELTVPALKVDINIKKALVQEQPITGTDQIETNLLWPRPTDKEIYQAGAFPGEIGNCVLIATQETLSDIRYVQQNDEIHLFDRNNNLYVYRVLSLSQAGEPERVIDLSKDSWVFQSQPGQALLTILVSMPLPPTLETLGSSNTKDQTQPQDDLTTTRRLAYRAVLVSYSPAKTKQAGTPVEVPANVWQMPQISESVNVTSTKATDQDDQKGGDQTPISSSK